MNNLQKETMKFNYSIVIPHRDSLNLLKRAIASVPVRSDIQIIIIDNTPYDIDFSIFTANNIKNLKLLHSDPTKGAGHARNVGLKEANGKWLLFLDADDYYTPKAFVHFDKYIDSEYDIIYFSTTSVFSDTMEVADRHIFYSQLIFDYVNGNRDAEDNLRYWFDPPWAKLIRNKLVQEGGIQFDEIPASNDLMFSIRSGHNAKKIYADTFPAYCITTNKGSLTQTINKKNSRSRYYASIGQYKFMSAINRPDLRFKLMATVLKSLRFGIKEFFWYISTAYSEKVNIFIGIHRWPNVIYRHFFIKRNRDKNYTVYED